MKITPIHTDVITKDDTSIEATISRYIKVLPERSILAVTSKVVSVLEGNVVPMTSIDKYSLVESQADAFIPHQKNKYGLTLTSTYGVLIPNAGVDESNGNGNYILWPKDPQKSANRIREFLATHFSLKEVGVIITDSRTTPLRWGVTGVALTHSGFLALNNCIGKPDIFGRDLVMTQVSVRDALATAAVFVMGETNEQTPFALVTDIPFVSFQNGNPTDKELAALSISMEDDIYAPILKSAPWSKGKRGE